MSSIYLPAKLAEYAKFPWMPLVLFSLFVFVVSFGAVPFGTVSFVRPHVESSSMSMSEEASRQAIEQASSSFAPAAASTPVLSVFGGDPLAIELRGETLMITEGSLAGESVELSADARSATLTRSAERGRTVARDVPEEQQVIVERSDGGVYRLKDDDDGYKLIDPNGGLLGRVKLKVDERKWNLYDAAGARSARGKLEYGEVVVKGADDRLRFRASLAAPNLSDQERLLLSSLLALPLEPTEQVTAVAVYLQRFASKR